MKKLYLLFIALLLLTIPACDVNDNDFYDEDPPAPPKGLLVLNGDSRVDISWTQNSERDLDGYNVYYSTSYNGRYEFIGFTTNNWFIDDEAVNGDTYFYAVTAIDDNGNESELSFDEIYSTPRPEGFNQAVFDYNQFPNNAGYSFYDYQVVPFDADNADFFFERFENTFYVDVYSDSDIKDMGKTSDIYDIAYAPTSGWSETKDAIAIPGHTYVIWTWDNHYAKIRIKSITAERMVFDWAYQLVEGERQLKTNVIHRTVTSEMLPKRIKSISK